VITKNELIYRQIITLSDGGRVLLRPLTKDDRQGLLDLFTPLRADDVRFLRHNVREAKLVNQWIDELDYDKVFPLVAVVNDQIVGNATLHFYEGPARHRAEVRIFLAKEIRRRGVGTRLLQSLIEIARRRSLYLLEAQIVTDQAPVIKAFRKLGFEQKCVLDDYFILPDGEPRDVAHLILRLRERGEEF
jgi:RimJ/RimL family protein N-acetyltransferase